ncbi:enoyl-CoA hydratase (plasmid) [Pseudonocardia sp. EC080610-09]|uniref:enoyl-CoA hydratase/isomerase family protein n=1 Tax=unclassified Pseudonocardia TaxID=2619320 RepID=UPI0007068406|nr:MULTISPECIES: enoyl-CoA hydratase/isomerase family protein [unclassified Pseudonocardia]ALL79738.1 enoyl-CoA hydratase [Pseudonocardia sp. EC080610-09]ALL85171.1 enoyl-CoA hydratase [Pseudonocardia sp. EC080619-01]
MSPEGSPVLLRIEQRERGRVAYLTLNRPEARNAVTVALAESLRKKLDEAAAHADVIVIGGAGGHFCAGGDFHEVSRLREEGPDALRPLFETFIEACELIGRLAVPVVAAVEGYAMAGGFELVQSVDVAVARKDAVLADNHANFGMIPGGGGSQRLPRLVGLPRALGHILLGERISGTTAAEWGLVHRTADADTFEATVEDVVTGLLAKDRGAIARIKQLIRGGVEMPLADGLRMETESTLAHLGGEDAGAGISRFTGRPRAEET